MRARQLSQTAIARELYKITQIQMAVERPELIRVVNVERDLSSNGACSYHVSGKLRRKSAVDLTLSFWRM
jgi:hypothetical protein